MEETAAAVVAAEEKVEKKRTSPQPREGHMKKMTKKNSIESDYLNKRDMHRLSTGEANIPNYQELELAANNKNH